MILHKAWGIRRLGEGFMKKKHVVRLTDGEPKICEETTDRQVADAFC